MADAIQLRFDDLLPPSLVATLKSPLRMIARYEM